ncbi:MAG: hypothetical protein ABIF18_02905 [archaeon]
MDLKQILNEHDKVYVDNCKLREIMNTPLNNEEKSKLVVTSEVKNEFLAQNETSPEEESLLQTFYEPTIHKLAHTSENRERTYLAANYLFKTLSLGTFREDLNNKVHEKIDKLVRGYRHKEFIGKTFELFSKLGLAFSGVFVPVNFENFLNLNFITKGAQKNYNTKIINLKNEEGHSELINGARKKRKRWIKRNLENILTKIGTMETSENFPQVTSFDSLKGYNYTDQDLITHASIDTIVNNQNIGIYTEDKDCLKLFDTMGEIFNTKNENNLTLYHSTIKKESKKSVNIPGFAETIKLTSKYLKNQTAKDKKHIRNILHKNEKYKEISPHYELFRGILSGAVGIEACLVSGQMLDFAYKLYSNEMTGEFINTLYGTISSGEPNALRGSIGLASILVYLPLIAYRGLKDSHKHLKTAIKYPNID